MTVSIFQVLDNQIRVFGYITILYLLTTYVQSLPTASRPIQEGVETGSSPDYTPSYDTTDFMDDEDLLTTTSEVDDNTTESRTLSTESVSTTKSSFIMPLLFTDWTLLGILAGVEILAYLFSLIIIYLLKHSGKNSALPIGRRKPLYRTISWKF